MEASNRLERPKREAWLRISRFATPIFLGLVILLVPGIYFWTRESRDPLEIAHEKIEEGMTTEEALAIVGRIDVPAGTIRKMDEGSMAISFSSERGVLGIRAKDGLVVGKSYYLRPRNSFFGRLRRLVGL